MTSSTSQAPVPNRSEVIQNLSVFLSGLDWVQPTAGNYTLCKRAHKMIKNILDRVLVPTPQFSTALPTAEPSGLVGFSLDGLPTFGNEYEEWFENMDWDAIAW